MFSSGRSKKSIIISWVIASIISLAMSLTIFFTRPLQNWASLSDATFIPSALMLGITVLTLIARAGTFDILAYSFAAISQRFRPREFKRYADAYDYKVQADERRAKRGGYILPYLVWGIVLLVIAIIAALLVK